MRTLWSEGTYTYTYASSVDRSLRQLNAPMVTLAEFASGIFLEHDVGRVNGLLVGLIAHRSFCGIWQKYCLLQIYHFCVRTRKPREVVVIVGIVDGHGLVRLIARGVARKARKLLTSGSRWAVVGDLVDFIARDCLR